jgi:hypothetical protein
MVFSDLFHSFGLTLKLSLKADLLYVPDLQFSKVSYVTVKIHGKELTEYDDFYYRMGINEKDRRQRDEINRYIERMGKIYGAQDQFFKREGMAERLPPPTHRFIDSDGEIDFGLRLYCVRLSDELVVLLNGDRKTAQHVRDCAQCKLHYDLANKVSDAIYYAKRDGLIEIEGKDILTDDGFSLEL